MNENELEIAQEGFDSELGFILMNGAAAVSMIMLSPMLARLGNNEPALFSSHDFKTSLKGLRSLFGGLAGSHVGFVISDYERKLRIALRAFRSNKAPIYMNEVMWDRAKEFRNKYESLFNDVKALISEYQDKIGPNSKGKFKVEKDNEVFEAANEWLEKYICISESIDEMNKLILKDVNGAKTVEKYTATQGYFSGSTQRIYNDEEKTGRRISPDVKVSDSEFYDMCNEDLCFNFKKTFKARKVLGHINARKNPTRLSMKENFESAIANLCGAYMYYICYIYILCSEAYHRK